MKITYHEKTDLLYIRLDERPQQVTNREVGDDIVLDLGEGDRIVGIEILDASKRCPWTNFHRSSIRRQLRRHLAVRLA